jgi:hypothetical protein
MWLRRLFFSSDNVNKSNIATYNVIAATVVMVVIAPALVQSSSAILAEKTETSCSDDKLMNCQAVLANPEMQQVTKREDDCTLRN